MHHLHEYPMEQHLFYSQKLKSLKSGLASLDIRVDDAWKIIISTGIVTPDSPENQQKVIDEALESAKNKLVPPGKGKN